MELAIFFHDLVYIPMKHPDLLTNEEMSAFYFQEFLIETRLTGFENVKEYILATIKHVPRLNSPEELEFLDIDLSILASP